MAATLRVTKADGGAVTIAAVPVTGAVGDFVGAAGTYSGQLLLTGTDGMRSYFAGWQGPGLPGATLTLQKDTVAPDVMVVVEPRHAALADAEPGFTGFWKKDEVATIRVTVDGGAVAQASDLSTSWVGGTVAPSTACSGACSGNCRCFEVELSGAPIPGMRATPTLRMGPIADNAGNISAALDAGIPVTRFKWARQMTLAANSTPLLPVAVSDQGVAVWGAQETPLTTARVIATTQDGGLAWMSVTGGTVTAGPLLATSQVWVGTELAVGFSQLVPIGLATGMVGVSQCLSASGPAFNGDLALSSLDGGTTEIPLGVRNGRVQGPVSGNCEGLTLATVDDPAFRPSLVVRTPGGGTTEAFVAYEGDTKLWKADLAGTSWNARGVAAPLPMGTQLRGLFLDGLGYAGGGGGGVASNGALFATNASGMFSGTTVFTESAAANAGPPAVGAGFLLYGNSGGDVSKVSYATGMFGGSTTVPAGVGNLQATTPVLGAGSLAYLIGSSGTLTVRRTSDLSEVWQASLAPLTGAGNVSQPALDVYRTAGGTKDCTKPLGVLYVTTRAGATATLRAILVDSKGLDETAPWPKYQRDNANTGNSSLSTGDWTCP
ncbi:MAG: hypothetical protein Q8N23_21440 [Archangium sp.]|nr:hypothetical protein [Archangium sp.]MDP3570918.1 hypothetical protein [Archangium sp.]